MDASVRTSRGPARRTEVLDGLIGLFLAEGFLRFSLEELAARLLCSKSTLYVVAPSKEQLITSVVKEFFRRATDEIEAELAEEKVPLQRIRVYLEAIARGLAPASKDFYLDVDQFGPARELYLQNTAIAAARVQELVAAAAGESGGTLDAAFIGAVAGAVMEAIQRGEMKAATSIDDATAYQLLADLIVAGVSARGRR